jgi:hypothetical protein
MVLPTRAPEPIHPLLRAGLALVVLSISALSGSVIRRKPATARRTCLTSNVRHKSTRMEIRDPRPIHQRFATLLTESDFFLQDHVDVGAYLKRSTKEEVAGAVRDLHHELSKKRAPLPAYIWAALQRLGDDIHAKADDPI